VIGLDFRADDLNVDWRGQAEVEDLSHDVGGQEIGRLDDAGQRRRRLISQLGKHVNRRYIDT
jgi:hypothetical protein